MVSICQEDSGGPSLAMNPANGWWYTVGVVSYSGGK